MNLSCTLKDAQQIIVFDLSGSKVGVGVCRQMADADWARNNLEGDAAGATSRLKSVRFLIFGGPLVKQAKIKVKWRILTITTQVPYDMLHF